MTMPTIGRLVHYYFSSEGAEQANALNLERSRAQSRWVANTVLVGRPYPMLVTNVGTMLESWVSGQVFLDGNMTIWKGSVSSETEGVDGQVPYNGYWTWPPRT